MLPRVDLCRLADPTVTDGPVVEIARFGLDDEYISFEIGPHSACYLGVCVCVCARVCARARVRACATVRACVVCACVRDLSERPQENWIYDSSGSPDAHRQFWISRTHDSSVMTDVMDLHQMLTG